MIQQKRAGILFVLPSVLFTLLFFIIPLIMTAWMSLHNWSLLSGHSFIGFENYRALARDSQFRRSLWFTTQYTLMVTPPIFILAFILALLIKLPLRGIGFFRTAYFMPVVIGLAASSLLWVWLLNDRVGVFDGILLQLGWIRQPIVWLGTKSLAIGSIIVSIVWKTVGLTMILLLTGMQAIPEDLYQAAMVDGANFWVQLTRITMPLLRRTFALALVISVIGSYLAFDQFFILTRGGPQNQTITMVYWIYLNSFTHFKMGYGSAQSIILLFILAVLSLVQLRLLRSETS